MTYLRLLPVAALLLAACATAPCVCRPADPPPPALTRAEVEAWARAFPRAEEETRALRMEIQRDELNRVIKANAERRERLYGGETP